MKEVRASLAEIAAQIDGLRELIPQMRTTDPQVSDWSVGMHIHHCALSMAGIAQRLIDCESPSPPGRPNLTRSVILRTGKIPRGVAQAPEVAWPSSDLSATTIAEKLDEAEALLDRLPPVSERAWFQHFGLGVLKKKAAVRFISVHNAHHLSIVADILA